MDSSASENFYGYIVASYSLGQMIASPIVGYLSNRLKKIRHLLYIGIFLAFLGNALYLCVHLFPIEERRYALLIGRFVTGIGSSNISLLKAYASSASTQRDRSRAIALVTGGVALGMTMGPAFQLLFTPIGYPGPNILISGLMLSMYTAPALMACIMNAVNAFCIFAYFREVYAGVISSRSQINRNEPALPKIDKRALFLCYFTRFTQMFINTNLETLGASLAMVLFAWTRTESVKYFSAAQAIMSLLAFLIYVGFIMFRFDRFLHERCNVIASLFALLLFHVLTYSYPFLPGHLTTYSSEDYPFNGTDIDDDISNEEIQHVGCDTSKFSWCNSVRSINPFYFYICYILFIGLAFPSLNVSLNTLFSKIIGPRRQGFQQGLLQMAGGAARMVGPVVISVLYSAYGPQSACMEKTKRHENKNNEENKSEENNTINRMASLDLE
uniref:Major facilitator superfamily (MFS) profile domain-containing protein n=1 Tax=Meloidogyne javanica TaxID=6303 RepID=A0A915MBD3_MELJA